jgi:putative flippase GtrA
MLKTDFSPRRLRPPLAAESRRSIDPRQSLRAAAARPLRFAVVGVACGLLQLVLLVVIEALGTGALAANVLAYLLSAQLNFLLSDRFIWGDRREAGTARGGLAGRWVGFHLSIAGTFLLNQLVFIVARAFLPDVLASAAGIGVSALANFVIQDRLTFRRRPASRRAF